MLHIVSTSMNSGSHIARAIELADTGGLSTTDIICIIHEPHVTQMLGFFDDGFHLLLHSRGRQMLAGKSLRTVLVVSFLVQVVEFLERVFGPI